MNARSEFVTHVGTRNVLCVAIIHGSEYKEDRKEHQLRLAYDKRAYNAFLHGLDFEYDNGYGGQELYGTIWYTDGTWSDRGEYDGSEWWMHNTCPPIPAELRRR